MRFDLLPDGDIPLLTKQEFMERYRITPSWVRPEETQQRCSDPSALFDAQLSVSTSFEPDSQTFVPWLVQPWKLQAKSQSSV